VRRLEPLGWWSNLTTFSVERFSPSTGGGRTPTEKYLSCALLNIITLRTGYLAAPGAQCTQ
jgi:hypothetical protein